MANKLYSDTSIAAIAAAIRGKLGTTAKYTVQQMAAAINSINTEPDLEELTVTPSETQQTKTPTKYGFSKVIINAISNTYIGSAIARKSSTDLTVSGATVTAPAGYYAAQAQKAVATGTAGTPSASKGTVSNNQVTVTPTVTNTTGYITGGTKTGAAVTIAAADLVSGSETKTENGTYDVTNIKEVVVNVPQSGGGGMNVQGYLGMGSSRTASLVDVGVSLTVAKTGTYNVSWMGCRNTNGGTSTSRLYINNSAYDSAQSTFTNTYAQTVKLTGVQLTAGQTVSVRARARSTSYYMMVGNLIIEQTA